MLIPLDMVGWRSVIGISPKSHSRPYLVGGAIIIEDASHESSRGPLFAAYEVMSSDPSQRTPARTKSP